MNTGDILLALISSIYPSIGLLGSIMKAITSEKPNSGMSFVLDMATSILPSGGFLSNLAVEFSKQYAIDMLPGTQLMEATRRIVPYSVLPASCDQCRVSTQYYGRKGAQILCINCISHDLSKIIQPIDEIYVFGNNASNFGSDLSNQNQTYSSFMTTGIHGSGVKITRSVDSRIPEFTFSYIDDDNMRWAMATWATLANHWPTYLYLALFDLSVVPWRAVERSSHALTPELKRQFGGRSNIKAIVAVVHDMFIGNHETGSPDPFVTWGTFGSRSEAFFWLRSYV